MATLGDVAALAGVSISAVSRVLSDAPSTRVRPETRERIRQAAIDLDYRPNFAGRALKFSRSNVLALIVPELTNAVFTELMRGVEEGALERDYLVLLGRADDMQPGGELIRKLVGEGRVDGVLLQLGDDTRREDVDALLATTAKVIFINSIQDGHVGSVVLPDERGGQLATQHLIDLGHERIAFVGAHAVTFTSARRERGFRAAMAAARIPVVDDYVVHEGYLPGDGRVALRTLMSRHPRPSALFVANVNAAIGILAEARTLGIRVPADLSVVAFHDAWTAENTWPPLTTVRMPLYELGRLAVESLYRRLQGEEVGDIVVEAPEPILIVRESSVRIGPGRSRR